MSQQTLTGAGLMISMQISNSVKMEDICWSAPAGTDLINAVMIHPMSVRQHTFPVRTVKNAHTKPESVKVLDLGV